MVPFVILCFNNHPYVRRMVDQLENLLGNPEIVIIDNKSTWSSTREYLEHVSERHNVIYRDNNDGHQVWTSPEIYENLPALFVLTDPDIGLNPDMPPDFVDVFKRISQRHQSERVGVALDISDPDKMFPYRFHDFGYDGMGEIPVGESQYWKRQVEGEPREMYWAPVDTTFCLYNKEFVGKGNHIRVAGVFTAKHLPWYKDVNGISRYERYMMYKDASRVSSIKGFEMRYLDDNQIVPVQKEGETFLLRKVDEGFQSWDESIIHVLDKYCKRDKQFLDIGAWVGMTTLYAMRKSCHVVSVEPDPSHHEQLEMNVRNNKTHEVRVDVEKRVVCHTSDMEAVRDEMDLMFAPRYLAPYASGITAKTISVYDLVREYNLDNLSLIHVDIEGGEELILDQLAHYSCNVPVYIRMYYSWWRNKDMDRFTMLTEHQKNLLRQNGYILLLPINN